MSNATKHIFKIHVLNKKYYEYVKEVYTESTSILFNRLNAPKFLFHSLFWNKINDDEFDNIPLDILEKYFDNIPKQCGEYIVQLNDDFTFVILYERIDTND